MAPLVWLGLLALPARAHDADILYAQLWRPEAGGAEVRERITLTADTLARLLPADADGDGVLTQADLDARAPALALGFWDAVPLSAGDTPCARGETSARVRETYVALEARFTCPPGCCASASPCWRSCPPPTRSCWAAWPRASGASASRTRPSPRW
ncbi:hypothetical protein [Melittangium boletus]|uniref:hypothetical protein n=1 Tax=Melittangium boletus TaxID=83453 RepID=UPI003DA6A0A3